MGRRVRGLLDAVQQGAADAGGKLRIHMTGNFSKAESDDILRHLPEDCFLRGRGGSHSVSVGSLVDECYPVRGMFNPAEILHDLQSVTDDTATVFVSFRPAYDRGYERLDVSQKVFELVEAHFADPPKGLIAVLQRLREHCENWAVLEKTERLFDAFVDLHEALKFKRAALGRMGSMMHLAVSARYVNRPLLAVPDRLSEDEERYFLPYVFNVSRREARMDYLDLHGSRPAAISGNDFVRLEQRLAGVADAMETIADTSQDGAFTRMAAALRIYVSLLRSARNFHDAQIIRDRNSDRLAEIAPRPSKTDDWTGSVDLLQLTALMRDELDNAQELIALLSDGGMDLICHGEGPDDEDTFLLSSDLIDQIQQKRRLMRSRWLDAEDHLTPPFK